MAGTRPYDLFSVELHPTTQGLKQGWMLLLDLPAFRYDGLLLIRCVPDGTIVMMTTLILSWLLRKWCILLDMPFLWFLAGLVMLMIIGVCSLDANVVVAVLVALLAMEGHLFLLITLSGWWLLCTFFISRPMLGSESLYFLPLLLYYIR